MAEPEATIRRELARFLTGNQRRLTSRILAVHGARAPDLRVRSSEHGVRAEDVESLLDHLSAAVAASAPALLLDYLAWARVRLTSRAGAAEDLAAGLDAMRSVLEAELAPGPRDLVVALLGEAERALADLPSEAPSLIDATTPHAELAARYVDALLAGDRRGAAAMILAAARGGTPVSAIYLHVLGPALHEVGRLWQVNRISVAEEHYCTAATQEVMARLHPWVFAADRGGRRLIASAVEDELHEVGARMVADFFEMAGWDAYYLGASTPTSDLVAAITARRADLLAVSATMTRSVAAVRDLVQRVRADRDAAATPILVGGYPFNLAPGLWRHVGADGSASLPDAAVELGRRLVEERTRREHPRA
jgi:methanogenic corrinoid protein MtbC1